MFGSLFLVDFIKEPGFEFNWRLGTKREREKKKIRSSRRRR